MDDTISRLVRIETKVDVLLDRENDQEQRVRALEKEQWAHRGGLALIGMLFYKLGLPWFHY